MYLLSKKSFQVGLILVANVVFGIWFFLFMATHRPDSDHIPHVTMWTLGIIGVANLVSAYYLHLAYQRLPLGEHNAAADLMIVFLVSFFVVFAVDCWATALYVHFFEHVPF